MATTESGLFSILQPQRNERRAIRPHELRKLWDDHLLARFFFQHSRNGLILHDAARKHERRREADGADHRHDALDERAMQSPQNRLNGNAMCEERDNL